MVFAVPWSTLQERGTWTAIVLKVVREAVVVQEAVEEAVREADREVDRAAVREVDRAAEAKDPLGRPHPIVVVHQVVVRTVVEEASVQSHLCQDPAVHRNLRLCNRCPGQEVGKVFEVMRRQTMAITTTQRCFVTIRTMKL